MVGIVPDPLGTATEMLAALDAGAVSSVELVEMHLARIEALDGVLNAIPVRTPELALEAAARADEIRAGGGKGALLGLPMTLKESTQVAGLPQSAGIESLADHRPSSDGLSLAGCSPPEPVCWGRPTSRCRWRTGRPIVPSTAAPITRGTSSAHPEAAPVAVLRRWQWG